MGFRGLTVYRVRVNGFGLRVLSSKPPKSNAASPCIFAVADSDWMWWSSSRACKASADISWDLHCKDPHLVPASCS